MSFRCCMYTIPLHAFLNEFQIIKLNAKSTLYTKDIKNKAGFIL